MQPFHYVLMGIALIITWIALSAMRKAARRNGYAEGYQHGSISGKAAGKREMSSRIHSQILKVSELETELNELVAKRKAMRPYRRTAVGLIRINELKQRIAGMKDVIDGTAEGEDEVHGGGFAILHLHRHSSKEEKKEEATDTKNS